LIGQGPLSNYLGPVYRPAFAAPVAAAFGEFLARERALSLVDFRGLHEHSAFLAALRARAIPGWSAVRTVRVATCPYADLTSGWEALAARRKGKQRASIARKWRALQRLGRLEFEEVTDPAGVEDALPTMFELFRRRWTGRHESGGFAGPHRAFHSRAACALAAAGHLRLSLLRLDGQIVAFAYGIRARGVTTSYVLAHDDALAVCSPGLLLLVQLVEAACRRGDPEYDFSIGEEDYKDAWATGTRTVRRLLCWRQGSPAAARARLRLLGTRAWVGARSVDWLRDLRREGVRRVLGGASRAELPDTPGLPAGSGRSWHVGRLGAAGDGRGVAAGQWTYPELVRHLSPRLLDLAVDRVFRGDTLLPLFRDARLLGVVWRADRARRALVAGERTLHDDVVFYHPIAAPGASVTEVTAALAELAAPAPAVVVARTRPADLAVEWLDTFDADARFRRAVPP
jgi:hypothetical protein